jgi:hypothetical protein
MSRDTVRRLPGRVPVAAVQGTLALDLAPVVTPPEPRADQGDGCPAPPLGGDVVSIDRKVRAELETWARRYMQAVVEIAGGDRPASQLVRWTTPTVLEELTRRAAIIAMAGLHDAGQGRGRRPAVRPVVHSVHPCFLAAGVAEVSVHVRHGHRSRAVAARFERRPAGWVCTALDFA